MINTIFYYNYFLKLWNQLIEKSWKKKIMINIELINILSYELSLVIRYVEITKCKIKRKKIGYKMKHNIL